MALPSTRLEYRIALSHVDRGLEVNQSVVLARHPSETARHVTLRVLAWCLFNEDRLEFGAGLSDPDACDLWVHDLTGVVTAWVECGSIEAERLQKIVRHNSLARVRVFLDDEARRDELVARLREIGMKRGIERIEVWCADPALVNALAADEHPRQSWTVTIVADHIYVTVGDRSVDGAVTLVRLAP